MQSFKNTHSKAVDFGGKAINLGGEKQKDFIFRWGVLDDPWVVAGQGNGAELSPPSKKSRYEINATFSIPKIKNSMLRLSQHKLPSVTLHSSGCRSGTKTIHAL